MIPILDVAAIYSLVNHYEKRRYIMTLGLRQYIAVANVDVAAIVFTCRRETYSILYWQLGKGEQVEVILC